MQAGGDRTRADLLNRYAWGQQPEAFIASWNLMTAAIRAHAPETYMLWSPNSFFNYQNDTNGIQGGYTPYWPGKDNVECVSIFLTKSASLKSARCSIVGLSF